jgi:hypothetical protein
LAVAPLMLQCRPHGLEVIRQPVGEAAELSHPAALCINESHAQPIGISLFHNLSEVQR